MVLRVKTTKIYEQTIILLVLSLVFLYDAFVDLIGFLDELIGLLSFLFIAILFVAKSKIKLYRNEYYIALSLILIAIVGLLSNYVSYRKGYITDLAAVFGDFILFFKAFTTYFAIRLFSTKFDSNKILEKLTKHLEWIFYVLVVFVVVDLIFRIYPHLPRYGITSSELFFHHPSRYSFAFSFIFLFLLPKYFKSNKGLLFAVLLLGILSLRVKFFGFVFLSILVLFYGKKLFKVSRTVFIYVLVVLGALIIWVFWDWMKMYFSYQAIDTGWSRGILLYKSPIIASDFFPLGTGFGTYSSYYSGLHYSWVYELYGVDRVYGISKLYWGFIADQYWPMVLGQFGYFGLLAMVIILYQFYKLFMTQIKININTQNNRYYYFLSALLGFLLLIMDSTSDAIYTQQRTVAMFMFFALVVNTIKQKHV